MQNGTEILMRSVLYQRAWQRNSKKLGTLFQRTCAQNKQFGFMVFFDGRKIGVDNAADIHWRPCYNLPCNADVVCNTWMFLLFNNIF